MFSHLPLHPALLRAVRDLGYTEATAVQEEVVPLALEGRDLRVAAETGSGKSLAFLLPTLHRLLSRRRAGGRLRGPRALVLLPSRELARQVHRLASALSRHTNLAVTMICGGEPFADQMSALAQAPDLLIATPGRLEKHLRLGGPDLGDLQVLVLDEADRMLDLGLAEQVMGIVDRCGHGRQTLLCSATLGHKGLRGLATAVLHQPEEVVLNSVHERHSHIRHQVILADDGAHKAALLRWLLDNEEYAKALVFANSRLQADRTGGMLQSHGQRAGVLHGDMAQTQRERVMQLLEEGAFNVLVATDVAARGLDLNGVDLVIHFDLPRRGELYLHRSGRTGRAGRTGTAISLVSPQEWNLKASLERYLRQRFEPCSIEALKGRYAGPKRLKASGKAAGSRKRKKGKRKTAGAAACKAARRKKVGTQRAT